MKFLQRIILVMFALTAIVEAQSTSLQINQIEEVFVQSWKTGSETVPSQEFRIVLSSEKRDYKNEIIGNSGKKYQLSINYRPSFKPAGMWKVELREVISKNKKKRKLGSDLLTPIENGPGMDYFPDEFFIGYLYPGELKASIDSAGNPVLGALPLCDSLPCYPIKTIRKIKVENFCVVIKVEDYKINERDKTKLESMEIFIEFKNDCK